jgi:hypothetical protein
MEGVHDRNQVKMYIFVEKKFMKRQLFFLLMSLCVAPCAMAQKEVKIVEVEIGFGVMQGHKADKAKSTAGAMIFFETRYNIPYTAFDIGLQGSMGSYDRDHALIENNIWNQHIMPRVVSVYVDYNYRKWRRVSLFGGLGFGYANAINQRQTDDPTFWDKDEERKKYFAVSPRIGAEFFNHLRLTLDYKLVPKYSYLGVNLGFAFGGGEVK